ncbi:MAG TPA: AAA family ATPase [Steroidobacteraceae bacterium]|nr:AAA family ATPase [Steroidobacteraceae bacterium]
MKHLAGSTAAPGTGASLRIDELLRAEAFPHPVAHIEVRETHISLVILTGPFAYKIKKPVKFDFIDASTLERRRRLCEEELRLNRRYAAGLYLDVVPIVRLDGRVAVGAAGPAIEYAVRMQQFDAASELPALLEANDVSQGEVLALAELLAGLHLHAPRARESGVQANIRQPGEAVLENLSQLIGELARLEPPVAPGPIAEWAHDQARALEASFRLREDSGYIRECHGDLHAANIVRWQGRLTPFDCIEFDPQLRWIDVINDLSFLVMDLVSRRRTDLAFALLSRYLETTGDYGGVPLLRFYAVHRALVRAKVDALAAGQLPQRAGEFRERLLWRIRAATDWMAPRRPVLILMHGPSGSGKSWLSERLVPALAAIRVRSDVERKRLAGIRPQQGAAAGLQQGIYSAEFSRRTYGRLADCAERCLQAGFNTIVDAAFLEPADRELFRDLAARLGAAYAIVACRGDPAMLAARIAERARAREDASDADLAILAAQLRALQPFPARERDLVTTIDTSNPNAVEDVVAAIGTFGDRRHVR